jgi:hypothetical protein
MNMANEMMTSWAHKIGDLQRKMNTPGISSWLRERFRGQFRTYATALANLKDNAAERENSPSLQSRYQARDEYMAALDELNEPYMLSTEEHEYEAVQEKILAADKKVDAALMKWVEA